MRNRLAILILSAAIFFPPQLFAQSWLWAKGVDCNDLVNSQSEGYLIKTDHADNVYAAGDNAGDSVCLGSHTFFNPELLGYLNSFQTIIMKYDQSGNLLWADAGVHGQSVPISMTVDAGNNLFVFGYFYTDSVRFGGQLLKKTDAFSQHFYLVKYAAAGGALWAKCWGGTPGNIINTFINGGIVVDKGGNVTVAGTYSNANLNIGVFSVSNTSSGKNDIFLAKFDPSGNPLWLKNFGGTDNDEVTAMTISSYDKIYMTGAFMSPSITFGSTSLPFTTKGTGRPDAFVVELDTAGNVIWGRSPKNEAIPYCVYYDTAGYVYFGGTLMADSVTFGTELLTATYGTFLAKYDTSGSTVWARPFASVSSSAFNNIYSITTDTCDNIWVSGGMADALQLDSTRILAMPTGSSDIMFMVQLNPGGAVMDASAYISGGDDNSTLASDSHGNIYLCGDYLAPHFSLGSDTLSNTLGGEQYFIAKYKPYTTCRLQNALLEADISPKNGVVIFPNPAYDEITVSYPGTFPCNCKLTISDISGRLIYSYLLKDSSATISVRDLNPGVYLCRIDINEKEMTTKKLVIMK